LFFGTTLKKPPGKNIVYRNKDSKDAPDARSQKILLERRSQVAGGEKYCWSGRKAEPGFGAEGSQLEISPVEKQEKTLLIREGDIVYACTNKNDSVTIRTKNGRFVSRLTLKELEQRLPSRPSSAPIVATRLT
jgi:hypothetical protein